MGVRAGTSGGANDGIRTGGASGSNAPDDSGLAITYSMWIQSCGCLNDLDGVEKVVQEMKGDSSWDTFANLASI
ncbi:unnamed protein product [Brassica oleracea]|uniref:(rape) hypothetical protein n=1 Tax=Brassica napus TaxID=3708 RepID=A0A816IFP2_BRANA|nr:unnamed protein product [Brassica napus]